ncbi:MAG: serine/threonine protein kinase [Planctomycetes bacterium]|nr:serine/threonine protein kinase [Planctomycetota bacterium]
MARNALQEWFSDGRPATIAGHILRLHEHAALPGTPLLVQRGQAVVAFLQADDQTEWVLKKFVPGRQPDLTYLQSVSKVLPNLPAFRSATQRILLDEHALTSGSGCYCSRALRDGLRGALLQPRQPGNNWTSLADEIRDGKIRMDASVRLRLCRQLTEAVDVMEAAGAAHRDLSGGNVLIDWLLWQLGLIDFDSVYHTSLAMPDGTTAGTEGYCAPFVFSGGVADSRRSWCPCADRYALAILNVEFLLMDGSSSCAEDGGLFPQEQLRTRHGLRIDEVRGQLKRQFPSAVWLFDSAIHASAFLDCPSTGDWTRFCNQADQAMPCPISIGGMGDGVGDQIRSILLRRRLVGIG